MLHNPNPMQICARAWSYRWTKNCGKSWLCRGPRAAGRGPPDLRAAGAWRAVGLLLAKRRYPSNRIYGQTHIHSYETMGPWQWEGKTRKFGIKQVDWVKVAGNRPSWLSKCIHKVIAKHARVVGLNKNNNGGWDTKNWLWKWSFCPEILK